MPEEIVVRIEQPEEKVPEVSEAPVIAAVLSEHSEKITETEDEITWLKNENQRLAGEMAQMSQQISDLTEAAKAATAAAVVTAAVSEMESRSSTPPPSEETETTPPPPKVETPKESEEDGPQDQKPKDGPPAPQKRRFRIL